MVKYNLTLQIIVVIKNTDFIQEYVLIILAVQFLYQVQVNTFTFKDYILCYWNWLGFFKKKGQPLKFTFLIILLPLIVSVVRQFGLLEACS